MKKGLHSQAPLCIIYLERYSESNLRVPSVQMYLKQHRPWRGDAISFCYNDCLIKTKPRLLLAIKSRLPLCSQASPSYLKYQRASNIGNSHPASCSIIQEYYTANRRWVQSNKRLNLGCLNQTRLQKTSLNDIISIDKATIQKRK